MLFHRRLLFTNNESDSQVEVKTFVAHVSIGLIELQALVSHAYARSNGFIATLLHVLIMHKVQAFISDKEALKITANRKKWFTYS